MGRQKYPELGFVRKRPAWAGQKVACEACRGDASTLIEVRFTWMRGEDEHYKACDMHADMARRHLGEFLQDCENKFKAGQSGAV